MRATLPAAENFLGSISWYRPLFALTNASRSHIVDTPALAEPMPFSCSATLLEYTALRLIAVPALMSCKATREPIAPIAIHNVFLEPQMGARSIAAAGPTNMVNNALARQEGINRGLCPLQSF